MSIRGHLHANVLSQNGKLFFILPVHLNNCVFVHTSENKSQNASFWKHCHCFVCVNTGFTSHCYQQCRHILHTWQIPHTHQYPTADSTLSITLMIIKKVTALNTSLEYGLQHFWAFSQMCKDRSFWKRSVYVKLFLNAHCHTV